MKKELKLYRCTISENDNDKAEVDFVALVENPAIKENFLAFNEQAQRQTFEITNEDEKIVTGLAMVADMPIYRNMEGREFYTFFDAATIKQIAQRFFRKKYNFNLNLNHNPEYKVNDVYLFESWIVDRESGKLPMQQFKDVADGSWFISAKIDNEEIWQAIKRGEFKGFSIEGFFDMQEINFKEQEAPEMTESEFDAALLELVQAAPF